MKNLEELFSKSILWTYLSPSFHFLPNGTVSRFVQDCHERQGANAIAFRARLRNGKRRSAIFDVVGPKDVAALCASEMCFSS